MRTCLATFVLALALPCTAETLAPDAVICLSESGIDELMVAARRGDQSAIKRQFQMSTCVRAPERPRASVTKQYLSGKARIWVDEPYNMEAWTLLDYLQ